MSAINADSGTHGWHEALIARCADLPPVEGGATIVSWATLRSNGSRTGSSGGAAHAVAKCQPPPAGGDRRSAIP